MLVLKMKLMINIGFLHKMLIKKYSLSYDIKMTSLSNWEKVVTFNGFESEKDLRVISSITKGNVGLLNKVVINVAYWL